MRTARAHFPALKTTFRSGSQVTTTLFDLMEALRKALGDKREGLIPLIVIHLMASGRIKQAGKRSRLQVSFKVGNV